MKNGRAKRNRNRANARTLAVKICPNCLKRTSGCWLSLSSVPGVGILSLLSPSRATEVDIYNGFYTCDDLYDPKTGRRKEPGTCGFIHDYPKDYLEQTGKAPRTQLVES